MEQQPGKIPEFIERAIMTWGPYAAGYLLAAYTWIGEWIPGDATEDKTLLAGIIIGSLTWLVVYLVRVFTPLLPDPGVLANKIALKFGDTEAEPAGGP